MGIGDVNRAAPQATRRISCIAVGAGADAYVSAGSAPSVIFYGGELQEIRTPIGVTHGGRAHLAKSPEFNLS